VCVCKDKEDEEEAVHVVVVVVVVVVEEDEDDEEEAVVVVVVVDVVVDPTPSIVLLQTARWDFQCARWQSGLQYHTAFTFFM
jgi:hypothetical protein